MNKLKKESRLIDEVGDMSQLLIESNLFEYKSEKRSDGKLTGRRKYEQ